MARARRISQTSITHHIVSRCHNRQFLFRKDQDFQSYLSTLSKYKRKFDFRLYNYILMSNHVHLIIAENEFSISKIMHAINNSFSRWYNRKYQRTGSFWEGRFKSVIIQDEAYFFELSRYIDLNMVRAGRVQRPEDWPWSGYQVYAYGQSNQLIDIHPLFLKKSIKSPAQLEDCQSWYRTFVYEKLYSDNRRNPLMSEAYFLGSAGFIRRMATAYYPLLQPAAKRFYKSVLNEP